MLVSIVLPVHNQADHIKEIVLGYIDALSALPADFEIILVPNACRDASPAVCKALAEGDRRVKVVLTYKSGWGNAVRSGLETAVGDLVGYANSARTSSDVLCKIVKFSLSNPDVIVKINRKTRDDFSRRLGSLLYNLECRMFFDSPVWDVNGTPKFFPRKFAPLLKLSRDDDLIDAEFVALCQKHQYPILEVPVLSTTRHGGKSTTNYGSAFKMYLGAYLLWRQLNRA